VPGKYRLKLIIIEAKWTVTIAALITAPLALSLAFPSSLLLLLLSTINDYQLRSVATRAQRYQLSIDDWSALPASRGSLRRDVEFIEYILQSHSDKWTRVVRRTPSKEAEGNLMINRSCRTGLAAVFSRSPNLPLSNYRALITDPQRASLAEERKSRRLDAFSITALWIFYRAKFTSLA